MSSGVARRPTLRPRRSLGQHFLRDTTVARRIVDSLGLHAGERVLEIGPGTGALTSLLVDAGAQLVVVELDPRAVALVRAAAPGVAVIEGDILATDLTALAGTGGTLRVVGNIPYNITSPILFHLLDHRGAIPDATLMMQREVARRIAARPGTKEYGIPSVITQFYADVRSLFDVRPGAFVPVPAITSTVLRLEMRAAPAAPALDEDHFRRMVRATFGQRRKTLRNSLRTLLGDGVRALPPELPLGRRPEELSVVELVELSNALVRIGTGRP